jgi:hypothetical protein
LADGKTRSQHFCTQVTLGCDPTRQYNFLGILPIFSNLRYKLMNSATTEYLLVRLKRLLISNRLRGFACDFEDGEESFLRDIDFADALHAALAFLLLLQQFSLS